MTGLIAHSLKSKKNWFFLNTVICVVVSIILPILFKSAYSFFAGSTIFIASAIILISTFSDLVFLHDDRKISYYLSKPISLTKKINISLISNVIFCSVTLAVTFFISSCAGAILSKVDYSTFINGFSTISFIAYAWLMLLIFVTTLSSELTGNTTVSVLVSIFNFLLPIILYFIAGYIFYILDTLVVGISTEMMSEIFLHTVLPLEKIYFLDFGSSGGIDIFFFVRLFCFCAVIYTVTMLFTGHRRNERTGDFIVHTGFKYFMTLFASLIFPVIITIFMSGVSLFALIAVMVLLSALSYYILISALNKTFKISPQALKIYLPFIALLIMFIFSASFVIKEKAKFVPNSSDVKAVYIGNSISYQKDTYEYTWESLSNAKYEEIKDNKNIIILDEKENIENVIEIQKTLMEMKSNDYYSKMYIIYYMNDGKKVVRDYPFPNSFYDEELSVDNDKLFRSLFDMVKTEEFINSKYRAFCDEEYINSINLKSVRIYKGNEEKLLSGFDYDKFSQYYMDDYKNFVNNDENISKLTPHILNIKSDSYEIDESYFYKDGAVIPETLENQNESIYELNFEYSKRSTIDLGYIRILNSMKQTRQYIDSLKIEME